MNLTAVVAAGAQTSSNTQPSRMISNCSAYGLLPATILTSQDLMNSALYQGASVYHLDVLSTTSTPYASNTTCLEEEDDEEEDIHVCGTCKTEFKNLDLFIHHKNLECSKKKSRKENISLDKAEEVAVTILANNLETSEKISHETFYENINSPASIDENHKLELTPALQAKNSYPCQFEGCSFSSKYNKDLTRHMRKHTGEKPFKCSVCHKGFSRSDKLKNHKRLHSGEKPYECTLCSYKTSDSSSLQKHKRVHTDERPFKCQMCPYKSKDSSQLTVHLRSHTGDSPFSCPYESCNTSFKTNSDLKRHVRIHTGEKPYKCLHCDYRCAIKSNLNSHIQSNHSDNKRLVCKICSFTANDKSQLRIHQKTHSSMILSCSECDYNCTSQQSFGVHMRKKHGPLELHKCSYCSFTCKWKGALSSHINKKHGRSSPETGKKWLHKSNCATNFKCKECNASFVRKDSFQSHIRHHQTNNVTTTKVLSYSEESTTVDTGTIFCSYSH